MRCAAPRCGLTCMVSEGHENRCTWPAMWLPLIVGMKPGCRITKRHPALLPSGPNPGYRRESGKPYWNCKESKEHGRIG
jgi:hypothetical protein